MLINRRGAFTLYKIPLLYSPLVEIGNDSTEILHKPRINGEYDCIFSAFRMPDFPGFSAENIHSNIQDFQPHGICRTPSAGLSGSAFFMFGRGTGAGGGRAEREAIAHAWREDPRTPKTGPWEPMGRTGSGKTSTAKN